MEKEHLEAYSTPLAISLFNDLLAHCALGIYVRFIVFKSIPNRLLTPKICETIRFRYLTLLLPCVQASSMATLQRLDGTPGTVPVANTQQPLRPLWGGNGPTDSPSPPSHSAKPKPLSVVAPFGWFWNKVKFVRPAFAPYRNLIGVGAGLATLLSVDALYVWLQHGWRIERIVHVLEHSSEKLQVNSGDGFVKRAAATALTKSHISSSWAAFNLITGEVGSGKSEIVKWACHLQGSGVMYFRFGVADVYSSDEFFTNLAKHFNVDTCQRQSIWSMIWYGIQPQKPLALQVLNDIELGAIAYRVKHNRVPCLVFDDFPALDAPKNLTGPSIGSTSLDQVNSAATRSQGTDHLELLIDFAKQQANRGNMSITFVCSAQSTVSRLLDMRHSIHMFRVQEVGDLTEDEARTFLQDRMDDKEYLFDGSSSTMVSRDEAVREIIKVLGGSIILLREAVAHIDLGSTIVDIQRSALDRARETLAHHGICIPRPPGLTERHKRAWSTCFSVLDSHNSEASSDLFHSQAGSLASDLLATPVFSRHPERFTVGFQSLPIKLVVEKLVGTHGSETRRKLEHIIEQNLH